MTQDPDTQSQALANYRQLLAKVDAKFAEIRGRHETSFQCAQGCHSCCKPGLTVGALETRAIQEWLTARPALQQKLATLAEHDPHQGRRCRLLGEDGDCTIYEARPIVCRSHGAPLKFKEHGIERRDVCPLNFNGDIAALSPDDVINLDMLNTLLALIGRQFDPSDARMPLERLWAE